MGFKVGDKEGRLDWEFNICAYCEKSPSHLETLGLFQD